MAMSVASQLSALWATAQRGALHRTPRMRQWMTALVTLVALRYHHWRITQTLPFEVSAAAALIYAFYGLELFTAYFEFKRRRVFVSTHDRSAEAEANIRWYGSAERAPLIDVLIPTYDEGRTLLRMTILAAAHQAYPRFRVWVLDDGRRPWVSELCSELRVNYVARAERSHFKAGNINHALQRLLAGSEKPEYIAVLDADCVAYPAFLERTLALMRDPGVGIVQTPQYFYNPDPFQHAFDAHAAWPEDWRANALLLTSLDARGHASCFGTAFLARAEALQAVGGFPTESLLEDALLSHRLSGLGWRTIYLNERLSVGRSVESLADLQRQRWRWHTGQMQMLLQDWYALGTAPALRARFGWIRTILAWFADPTLRLLWLVVPTLYWFTGIAVVRASTEDVLSHCLPMLVVPQVVMFWLSRGAIMPFGSHAEQLLLAPGRIAAGLAALAGRAPPDFFVTPKAVERRTVRVQRRTLGWTLLLLLALLAGVVYRLTTPWPDPSAQAFLLWNAAATGLFALLLWVAMVPCIERPRHRKAERYSHRGRARLTQGGVERDCVLHDLSVTGARVSPPSPIPAGSTVHLALSDQLEIAARVVRMARSGEVGLEFLPTAEQEAQLIHFVLCSPAYVPQPERWSWWRFCAAVARGSVGVRTAAS